MNANVLQLLPRVPGTLDGVGDYALELARGLRAKHAIDSVFVARETESQLEIDSFSVFPLQEFSRARLARDTCDGVILHYVNYGFQKRGVPLTLVSFLKSLQRECGGALLVIFHELFASGPPWRSEFWLHSLQKKIAGEIARIADVRLVSCESMRRQIEKLSPDQSTNVQPVTSTWGEPELDEAQLRDRDPHCWIICGGTALVERSLRTFLKTVFPPEVAPHKLFVVGGAENSDVRSMLNARAGFTAEYHPAITRDGAAPIFRRAAFAWIDYFDTGNMPTDVLLKSSTFNALCAHGVISVTPSVSGAVSVNGDVLPAPFTTSQIPAAESERAGVAVDIFHWYHRHASSAVLSRTVAQQMQLA